MAQDQKYDDAIRVRVGSDRRHKLEEIAHERCEPGDKVTVSDLVRNSIDELLESVDS